MEGAYLIIGTHCCQLMCFPPLFQADQCHSLLFYVILIPMTDLTQCCGVSPPPCCNCLDISWHTPCLFDFIHSFLDDFWHVNPFWKAHELHLRWSTHRLSHVASNLFRSDTDTSSVILHPKKKIYIYKYIINQISFPKSNGKPSISPSKIDILGMPPFSDKPNWII